MISSKFLIYYCLIILLSINIINANPELYQYTPNTVKTFRHLAVTCPTGQAVIEGACKTNDLDDSQMNSQITLNEADKFIVKWSFEGTTKIVFWMEVQKKSYISMGIGQAMSDADIISAEINADNQVTLIDTHSTGYSAPAQDTQQDATLLGYEVTNGSIKVKFSRLLDTGDSQDKKLVKGQKFFIMGSYAATNSVSQHSLSSRNVIEVTLDENQNFTADEVKPSTMHMLHTLGHLFVWGILVDIGIIITRHFKTWRWYMWAHAIIFLIVDFYTWIVGWGYDDDHHGDDSDDENGVEKPESKIADSHEFYANVLLLLLFAQHASGVAIKQLSEVKKMRMDVIYIAKKIHLFLGWFLYIFGKCACLSGSDANRIFYNDQFYFSQGIIFVSIGISLQIISKVIYEIRENKLKKKFVDQGYKIVDSSLSESTIQKDTTNEQIVQMIQTGKPFSEIKPKLGKHDYVGLLGNNVFLLKNFVHPGGQYIMEKVNGREVDRCFFGGYALEGDRRPAYDHSYDSEIFVKNNTIGVLQYPEEQNVLQRHAHIGDIWKQVKVDDITPTTAVIHYQSEIKMKNYLKGVEWFGRYFLIQMIGNNKRRLYTTAQCMSSENVDFRAKLTQFALNNFEGDQWQKLPEFSDTLPFVIKNYGPFKAGFPKNMSVPLSKEIFEGQYKDFSVQGPQGTGLHLNENSQGTYIIVTGGTGILPFLDLLSFVLQKAIYEVAKKEKGEEFAKQNIDVNGLELDKYFNNDFKICLYASFPEQCEFLGQDIIQPLAEICSKFQMDIFSHKLRFRRQCQIPFVDMTKSTFNKEFFDEESRNWKNVQKLWICGPPPMNGSVPNCVKGIIDEEKIVFI